MCVCVRVFWQTSEHVRQESGPLVWVKQSRFYALRPADLGDSVADVSADGDIACHTVLRSCVMCVHKLPQHVIKGDVPCFGLQSGMILLRP